MNKAIKYVKNITIKQFIAHVLMTPLYLLAIFGFVAFIPFIFVFTLMIWAFHNTIQTYEHDEGRCDNLFCNWIDGMNEC